MIIKQSDIDRFWSKIIFPNDIINDCWEYIGQHNIDGYSIFWCDRKGIRGNRFSYIIHNGFKEIETGLLVCHSCDNPGCINPKHLFLGTNQDNETDKVNKNRQAIGSKNGNSNLIEEEVEQIIKLIIDKKHTGKDISERFNVSTSCICRIKKGVIWKHLTDDILQRYNIQRYSL